MIDKSRQFAVGSRQFAVSSQQSVSKISREIELIEKFSLKKYHFFVFD